MRSCEAQTFLGQPCLARASYTVEVDGVPHRLCGNHVRLSRRSPVWIWQPRSAVPSTVDTEPVVPRSGRPWTAEEETLAADLSVPTAEVAARLGRSIAAVRHRRAGQVGGQ